MHRLLIVEHDEAFLMAAVDALGADFEVQTCRDGDMALELLNSFQPQALIINLSLPFKDGLTVLQEAAHRPPVILAISDEVSPYVKHSCFELNVGYLMRSPCLNALRVRIVHMANQWASQQKPVALRAQTVNHLHAMNFPSQRTGYPPLCDAIALYYRDRNQCLETSLYVELAHIHNTTVKAVEKAMREVIKQAWENRDPVAWQKYFQNQDSCPSNKVFFSAVADHLKE